MSPALLAIIVQAGAPVLKAVLESKFGAKGAVAGAVVDAIAGKLDVPPTVEAIAAKAEQEPAAVQAAVREVEADADWLAYLGQATAERDGGLKTEDGKSFFHSGWRPAMSWLVIFLFGWALVILPVVNAAFKASIAAPPIDAIVQFSGLWLVVYGGGHTLKSIWGK